MAAGPLFQVTFPSTRTIVLLHPTISPNLLRQQDVPRRTKPTEGTTAWSNSTSPTLPWIHTAGFSRLPEPRLTQNFSSFFPPPVHCHSFSNTMKKMKNPPAEESDPGSGHDICQASATATTSAAQPSGGLGARFSNDQVAELFPIAVAEINKKAAAAAHSALERIG